MKTQLVLLHNGIENAISEKKFKRAQFLRNKELKGMRNLGLAWG